MKLLKNVDKVISCQFLFKKKKVIKTITVDLYSRKIWDPTSIPKEWRDFSSLPVYNVAHPHLWGKQKNWQKLWAVVGRPYEQDWRQIGSNFQIFT